ncbi:FRG domain-containing protein [Roseixanthobacter pseudopolyaromaticivorans]|uniref:FRG domain-containing protein n=1 Tax=Xanthobacteraceae TaxID=335928 RepID=UPI003726ED8B
MHGQWVKNSPDNSKIFVLDIDDCGTFFEGHAYYFVDGCQPAWMPIRTSSNSGRESTSSLVFTLTPDGKKVISGTEISQAYPDGSVPPALELILNRSAKSLRIDYRNPLNQKSGYIILRPGKSNSPGRSPIRSIKSWQSFKKYAISVERGRYIFRGQSVCNRLRTAFHRTRRKDLFNFITEDIPYIHRVLSAKTHHLFNLADPAQNGAFWNLIQHHGYPTPLLDWTYSPFVASYFAFKGATAEVSKVRIFVFDKREWMRDFKQMQTVIHIPPHFSIFEALPINNERSIPQQAISTVSNVDDIETYIKQCEKLRNKTYLQAIDLPSISRPEVLRELSLMGITPGSLFPGFDGICQEMRERYFEL